MFVIYLYFKDCNREVNQDLLNQKHLLQSKTLLGLFLDPTKKIVTRPSLYLIHTLHHIHHHDINPSLQLCSSFSYQCSTYRFIFIQSTCHNQVFNSIHAHHTNSNLSLLSQHSSLSCMSHFQTVVKSCHQCL